MSVYTNTSRIPLSVAVYLATDNYDYDPSAISATSLLKATRQLVLSPRVPAELNRIDIQSLAASRMGTAIHDSVERAWKGDYQGAMRKLGYPEKLIERVIINPEPEQLEPHHIPVYMELRGVREINGTRVSGKFDFVGEGRLEDFKSTSTFAWKSNKKDEDYQKQGSIYRWLFPHLITHDVMAIQFFFKDWQVGRAAQDPAYPQSANQERLIPLLSLDETEHFISQKLNQIKQYNSTHESELPLCTDAELWRDDPVFKYYKNPEKRTRSTGNFDTAGEAYARRAKDGNVGIVVEVPGEAKACKWCNAFPICTQKDSLIADGTLKIA